MAKRNASPHEYANETARSLNPFFGFIPDPDYQWNDDDVIGPLYYLGQAMRTRERRRQDQLIHLGERSPHQEYTETDDHHLLSAAGVSYHEVMGQNMPRPPSTPTTPSVGTDLPPRRRPTEAYQVIDPSTMEGTSLALTEGRLSAALAASPTVQRNLDQFKDSGSRVSDPMSSSYVPPSERIRRRRMVPTLKTHPLPDSPPNEIAGVLPNPFGTPE